jgi:hypothetical protein
MTRADVGALKPTKYVNIAYAFTRMRRVQSRLVNKLKGPYPCDRLEFGGLSH